MFIDEGMGSVIEVLLTAVEIEIDLFEFLRGIIFDCTGIVDTGFDFIKDLLFQIYRIRIIADVQVFGKLRKLLRDAVAVIVEDQDVFKFDAV